MGDDGPVELRPQDQVPRLQMFRRQHPSVEIAPPERLSGRWVACQHGRMLASEYELIRLLDDLEEMDL